ncbi:MAG: MFS transporter, partial [Cyanobacteria bacterium J06626_14]
MYSPMILARTDGSATILASTSAAAGLGGVAGAILLSVWGGPKRYVSGMLIGFMGAGFSKIVFGLGRSPLVWLPAQFCSSLNFPLLSSSENAIWMTRIAPDMQGRVFAANSL